MANENPFEANLFSQDTRAQQDSAHSKLVNEALDLKKRNPGTNPTDLTAMAAVPVVLASANTPYPWYLPEGQTPVAPQIVKWNPPGSQRHTIPKPLSYQPIPDLSAPRLAPIPDLRQSKPLPVDSWGVPYTPQESKKQPPAPQKQPEKKPPVDRQVPKPADRQKPSDHKTPGENQQTQKPGDRRPEVLRLPKQADKQGTVYEMYDLKHSTGKHQTPDAMVYIPDGFDPKKPVRVVVYNHGLGTDAKEAFNNSKLQEQMKSGDPNTILIVPEWQTKTQSRVSRDNDPFHADGFFKNMLNEVFSKTPELRGKTTDDIASFGLITHSGGYKATESQLYKNGINGKVTSLTVLDSMYDPKGYDQWVQDNIDDLASGKKRLLVVYTDHLSGQSNGLAERTKKMLRENGHSTSDVVLDKDHPKTVTDARTLRNHGIVFKYSTLRDRGNDAHNTMTGHYVKEVIASERK